jgi:TrmH family RNA methyltransferase
MTIEKITSRDNRRLVDARKVRDGKVSGQIFIEGRRLVEEALASEIIISDCFLAESFQGTELLNAIISRDVAVFDVPDRIFASLADTKHPQGVILIATRPESSLKQIEAKLSASPLPIVVYLKEVNNPSNLGAVLRTAEAAGSAGAIISENSADAYSPKALRAAMGAAFRLSMFRGARSEDILVWARSAKLTPTATTASAGSSYTSIDWKKPRLLIFGSEAHGLSDLELKQINETVRIPMEAGVESLNLAVSAGIILFEARRQNTSV